MRITASSLVLVAASAIVAAPLRAQTTATPSARPAYDMVRYREDWSKPLTGDLMDPLKHIALWEDGWLSLGGHVRARAERDDNFLGGGAGTRTDNFGLVRVHLHGDLHVMPRLRAFVEGRLASARGRDLPGGFRTTDRDDADVQQAFVELNDIALGSGRWTVRVGRQELLFGRERVLSPLDWANARRTFQGAVIEGRDGALTFTALWAHPVTIVSAAVNVPDVHTQLWGAQVTWQHAASALTDIYALVKGVDAAGVVPASQRATLGARTLGPIAGTAFAYELEGGMQLGTAGNADVQAWMLATDLTRTWSGPHAPALTVGADYASGTGAGAAAQSGTWDQLYPLAHAFLGFADALGRRNVIEERIVAQWSASSTVRLRGSLHAFQRASTDDAIYDATGAVLRGSVPNAPREIGGEADLTAIWRIGRHLRVDGGVARFTPGAFFAATGASQPYSWGFLSVTATF